MITTPSSEALNPPNCPICGNPSAFWFRGYDGFYQVTAYQGTYWYCQVCAFGFLFPIPSRETVATFYPTGYWRESNTRNFLARCESLYSRSLLKMDLFRWVKRAIRFAFLKSGQRGPFVDLGCSRGDLPALVLPLTSDVLGVEGDERAVRFARERFGLDVFHGDLESWIPTKSFRVISAFHVLEHLRDPIRFLEKLRQSLEPEGYLVLRVPNARSFQARLLGSKWKGLEVPRHLSHFSPKALKRMLHRTGFEVEKISSWSLRDGPPALTSSLFKCGEPTWQLIQNRPRGVLKILYFVVNTILTPVEIIASLFGQGAMVTILCRRKHNHTSS